MENIGGMKIFEAAQNLIDEHFDMIAGQRLGRNLWKYN
jgi:hypothetical protein